MDDSTPLWILLEREIGEGREEGRKGGGGWGQ